MRVVFEKMIIQNLLSFGNSETEIVFDGGLNLITGPNGVGKSSALLDALSFALYDKAYRKINKADLINRHNKKNLKVDVTFSINDVPYRIIRGLKHSKVDLEFYINNKKQQLLSSKSLSQAEIEKRIGVDYKLFKQIISLSINYNKPFLTLPAGEKRDLLEKFFSIDMLADMLKSTKSSIKTETVKRDMYINSIEVATKFLTTEKTKIVELEKSKKTFDSDIKAKLEVLDGELSAAIGMLSGIKSEGIAKNAELKSYGTVNVSTLRDMKTDIASKISVCEFTIKTATSMISTLNGCDVCPTCNSELTDAHKKDEISSQEKVISDNMSTISTLEDELVSVSDKISQAVKDNDKISDLSYDIRTLKTQYTTCESKIDRLKTEISNLSTSKFAVNVSDMKKEYNKSMRAVKAERKSLIVVEDDLQYLDYMKSMLSDTGIKSYVFEQLIPILNKNINEYLKLLQLPVYIEFDSSMNDSIKTIANFNQVVSYYSFSEGEKKKIDMSILLSFIEVTKKVANWNCNLLIIDELLDSSIDDIGLGMLLQSLRDMVDINDELGVYVISHRVSPEYKTYFNNTITINKNSDGFSKLSYS